VQRDLWRDDAQVVRIVLGKRYSETPGALMKVLKADGEAA
jgi:Holliday junction resolvase RusA-like endonuclease